MNMIHRRHRALVLAVATVAVTFGAGKASADDPSPELVSVPASSPLLPEQTALEQAALAGTAVAPSAPQSLVATPLDMAVKLTWMPPASNGGAAIDKYQVERATSSTGRWMIVASPTGTSYTNVRLTNGTKYYFRIRAHNVAGWSAPSTFASATPGTVPSPAQSPVATPQNQSVKLTWVKPASDGGAAIDKYQVQRATSSTGPWTIVDTSTATTYTNYGLTNGTKYYFRIRAHNVVGWSLPSTLVNATPRAVPTSPQYLSATAGNSSVKLTWVAPLSNGGASIDKYLVQRSTASAGPWTTVAYPTTTGFTVTGLSNGTKYYFRVRAHNAAGWSPPSTLVNATPRTVPTAPTAQANSGNTWVKLTWSAPASNGGAAIDQYAVQRAITPFGPWTTIASPSGFSAISGGLSNGTKYFFRIRAHNAVGWSPYSTIVDATPHRTAPMPPHALIASAGNSSVTLGWLPTPDPGGVVDVDKYAVYWRAEDAYAWSGASVSGTSHTVTGLTNGTTYDFYVLASNAAGWSDPSAIVSAVPGS